MQCPNKRGHCGTEQTRAGTAMTEVTICPEKRLSQLNLSEQGERPYLQCRTSSGWPPFCRWWCWWHISQTQTVRIAENREKNSSYGQGTLVQGHGCVAVLGNSPERSWEPQLAAGAPRLPSGPTGASSLPDPRALRAAPPWLKPLSAEESSSGSSGGVPALSSRLTSGKAPFAYTISSDVFPQPPSPTITIFTSFFPDGAAALPPFPPAAPSGTAPLAASMEPSAAQRPRDSAPQRSPGAGRHRPRSAGDWPRPGALQVAPGAAWGRADTAAAGEGAPRRRGAARRRPRGAERGSGASARLWDSASVLQVRRWGLRVASVVSRPSEPPSNPRSGLCAPLPPVAAPSPQTSFISSGISHAVPLYFALRGNFHRGGSRRWWMREVRAKRGAEGQESPEVPQRVCMGHREGRWQTVCLLLYPVPCVQGELS